MENKAILPTTPPSEIDSNSLEIINEFTFSFAESIDRVWTLIRDLKLLSSLSASNTFPIIDIKTYGETWVVGNIFEGNIMGFSKFCAKCIKNKIYPNYKKIKWHFTYEEQKIDWSKVVVDTPVLVRDFENSNWFKRYFAKFENGKVYAWCDGRTSWNANDNTQGWQYAKLAEVGDE